MRVNSIAGGSMIAAIAMSNAQIHAAQVTYQFTTTVQTINPDASGFPPELVGVAVGAQVVGTFSYETSSPAVSNPFGFPYSLATRYALNNASFSFNFGGAILDAWSGPTAFVWNDDALFSGVRDGLIYTNTSLTGNNLQFQFGSFALPTSTFGDEALPDRNVPGGFLLEISGPAGMPLYLRTSAWQNLTVITPCLSDIAPPGGDGAVNVGDLLEVINNWGPCQ